MFCTNLRRRGSFASVLPILISNEGLKLKENKLETHDLAIPLPTSLSTNGHKNNIPIRHLRVLLLSPTSTSAANFPQTLDRIHHFASLTGGQDLLIVFLISQPGETNINASAKTIPPATTTQTSPKELLITTIHPTLAFTLLQASLLPRTDIPYIPLLPLSSPSNLHPLLQKHASALTHKYQNPPTGPKNTPKALDLLQLATTEPPMDRETLFFVTDCFANLRELANACTEPGVDLRGLLLLLLGDEDELGVGSGKGRVAIEKLRELRDLVGQERFMEITDFWADEWVIE